MTRHARQRLYNITLWASVALAVGHLVAASADTQVERRGASLRGSGWSTQSPTWGQLQAAEVLVSPKRATFPQGIVYRHEGTVATATHATAALSSHHQLRMHGIDATTVGPRIRIKEARLYEGDLTAKGLVVQGTLRPASVRSIALDFVAMGPQAFRAWRGRIASSQRTAPHRAEGASEPSHFPRLHAAIVHGGETPSAMIRLRDVTLELGPETQVRAKRVEGSLVRTVWDCTHVTLVRKHQRRSYRNMKLDTQSLTLRDTSSRKDLFGTAGAVFDLASLEVIP